MAGLAFSEAAGMKGCGHFPLIKRWPIVVIRTLLPAKKMKPEFCCREERALRLKRRDFFSSS
ncbi:hypothetical protein ACQK5W_03360 [Pantoea sp. FN060301]|uniref:hypothetical protein n=1 Tax=Pantoea sp. FN060301 TaxID=3420380 RepID=UPI003D165EB5